MSTDTSTIERIDTTLDNSITIIPPCEAHRETCPPGLCGRPAANIVRFKAHGCVRDGRGVLLCEVCRDWIAGQVEPPVGCAVCHGPLFIVSTVSLR